MKIHKYRDCYNGYTWSICGYAFVSRSRQSVKYLTKDWAKVTCEKCLKKLPKIKNKLSKAFDNCGCNKETKLKWEEEFEDEISWHNEEGAVWLNKRKFYQKILKKYNLGGGTKVKIKARKNCIQIEKIK